ncbi:MAG: hypothetical protein WC073_10950 [Sterolibacterium sp.]
MARAKNPITEAVADYPINEGVIIQQQNQMAAHLDAINDNAQALAVQMGYEGMLTVGALEDEIRFYQRRTAEVCLELGKRLLILKELTPFGEFEKRVELLGFHVRAARRFMQAAFKFSKSDNLSVLAKNAGTQSKLLELVMLDDDELTEIADGGSLNGVTLDSVGCMTPKELREALRKEREGWKESADIAERQLRAKDDKINQLDAELSRSMPTPEFLHEEALGLLSAQAIKCAASVQTSLRSELGRLFGVAGEAAPSEQARQAAAAALGQVLAAVRDVAADFGVLADASAVIDGEAQENADIWRTVGEQYDQATGG